MEAGGMRHHVAALLASLGILAAAAPADAHPHVFVTVRTEVLLGDDGTIAALRHAWTFDEPFSTYATAGMDTNKDGRLDRAELAELAKVNVESLSEYGFFSFLKKGKTNSAFAPPRDYWLEHDGKALTLHFTLPVEKQPLPIAQSVLEVYDPSYFVAFEFARENPVTVSGGKLACTASIKPPSAAVTQRLSQLSESFFQSLQPGGQAEWAIPVRFTCQ